MTDFKRDTHPLYPELDDQGLTCSRSRYNVSFAAAVGTAAGLGVAMGLSFNAIKDTMLSSSGNMGIGFAVLGVMALLSYGLPIAVKAAISREKMLDAGGRDLILPAIYAATSLAFIVTAAASVQPTNMDGTRRLEAQIACERDAQSTEAWVRCNPQYQISALAPR